MSERLFDLPAPIPREPVGGAPVETVEAAPDPPQLLEAPLQVVEELWRSVTFEERTLLAELFPRPGLTLPMGQALYGALATIGMRARRRPLRPSDWFEASEAALVRELKGHCKERQVRSYLRVLDTGGLITRQRRGRGKPSLCRLPHYRVPGRPAISNRSTEQDRQPITGQAPKTGNTLPVLKERNGTREKNVVRLGGRGKESPSDLLRALEAS